MFSELPGHSEAISKADEAAHDALVELIELVAMKDYRYTDGTLYRHAMEFAATEVLETFQHRLKSGALV